MPLTDDPVWLEDVLSPALGNRLRILPDWKESGVGGTMGRIWGIIWHYPADARASAQSIRNGRPDLQPSPHTLAASNERGVPQLNALPAVSQLPRPH